MTQGQDNSSTGSLDVDADAIAQCALNAFDRLPSKYKPAQRSSTMREWVPLAGVVLSRGDGELECVSVCTGMKCLPHLKVQEANGNVLHDCHAEILAVRAFNRFLLDECRALVHDNSHRSKYLRRCTSTTHEVTPSHPFKLQEGTSIYMFCSEAPCGDASMELIMQAQDDATPWDTAAAAHVDGEDAMLGRGHFSRLGIVRRKPARSDAPVSLSKSCTDKLTAYQITSLLSSLTSTIISPCGVYLRSIILPASQLVPAAVERAFSRVESVSLADNSVYITQRFTVLPTAQEFAYSRRCFTAAELAPSNKSAVWMPRSQEVLINGILQGRKKGDPRRASALSRRRMWQDVCDLLESVEDRSLKVELLLPTYGEAKVAAILSSRQHAKDAARAALGGWTRNTGDESFGLRDTDAIAAQIPLGK